MEKIHSTKSKDIICNVITGVENLFCAEFPKRDAYIHLYSGQIDELVAEASEELRELQKAVANYLAAPNMARPEYEKTLEELVASYEPTDSEQGLVPIPDGYAEQ